MGVSGITTPGSNWEEVVVVRNVNSPNEMVPRFGNVDYNADDEFNVDEVEDKLTFEDYYGTYSYFNAQYDSPPTCYEVTSTQIVIARVAHMGKRNSPEDM